MAKKGRKFIPNQHKYKHPLPIHPLDLPELIPHNPVSWAYWLYKFFISSNQIDKIPVEIRKTNDKQFMEIIVPSAEGRDYLWQNGFFGKGKLSRTEATWFKRSTNVSSKVSLEEVTKLRRQQRIQFKQERLKFEEKQLELRKEGIMDPESLLLKEREFLREMRDKELDFEKSLDTEKMPNNNVEENQMSQTVPAIMEDIEEYVLSPVETFFLVYGLDVLDISRHQLASSFTETLDISNFVRMYAAYHFYRSRGWCVRDGVKFGCDYLIYKRGPPFFHAEFAIKVLNSRESNDYTFYSSISRVIGGASKTLVLTYITVTKSDQEIIELWETNNFKEIFENSIQINEIIYKRWSPGKHRD